MLENPINTVHFLFAFQGTSELHFVFLLSKLSKIAQPKFRRPRTTIFV